MQAQTRTNTRNEGYRQNIIATRQIVRNQEPRILSNPRQDLQAVQHRQQQAATADRRAQHIAVQQVHMVQDQVPNPAKANGVLYGQALTQLRRVNDIGRHTSIATNTHLPLQQRSASLHYLRTNYGIPVTQQNFQQFRQAQAFHQFLSTGKEGDTFNLPVQRLHGVRVKPGTTQTYQLQKVQNQLVPVAVHSERHLSLSGALSGHPYQKSLVADAPLSEALAAQGNGIASGFVNESIDAADFGAKAIPKGTIGTPLRRAVTDLASLGPNTITGTAALGIAAAQAATGNTKPIAGLAKSFAENDPLGRLIVHGDTKAIAQHPGIALAELAGGATALDRLAGRVERGGGVFKAAPPEVRSLREVPLSRQGRQSRYSEGYYLSRAQKARDAKVVAKFNSLRKDAVGLATQAKTAEDAGNLELGAHLRKQARDTAQKAERYNPNRVRQGYDFRSPHPGQMRSDLERIGDVQEGTDNFAQRQARGKPVEALVGKRAVRSKNRTEGVISRKEDAVAEVRGILSQGDVAAHRGELLKKAQRLQAVQGHLDEAQRATNEHIVSSIYEVLGTHSDAQLRQLGEQARKYSGINRAAHEEALANGIGTRAEFEMSTAKPFAVEQMGAIPGSGGKLVKILHAPRDFSHWENAVVRARDALNRARGRGNVPESRSAARASRHPTPPEPPKRTYQGEAVWQGHAGDQPVRVTGFAGRHGDRDYMHIAESSTAIPKDELRVPGRNAGREGVSTEGGAASDVEIRAKQQALKKAVDDLNAEKAKGTTVPVEHVLTLDEIHHAMNAYADRFPGLAMRPGEHAFISHSSRAHGAGAFNRRADKAAGLPTARRTGAGTLYGTASVGRDAQIAAVTKLHVLSQQVKSFRNWVARIAIRDPERSSGGSMGLIQETSAANALDRYDKIATDEHGLLRPGFLSKDEVLPMRLNPLGGREEQLAKTLEHADEEGNVYGAEQANSIQQQLLATMRGEDTGGEGGVWTVVPKESAARRLEHATVAAGTVSLGRSIATAFRRTVLPFSPSWLTGNAVEANLRAAIAGYRPGDAELENRVFTEWASRGSDEAARTVLAIGYGHLGSVDTWAVKSTAANVKGIHAALYDAAQRLREAQISGHKPGEAVANFFGAYTHWMLDGVNGTMEGAIKRGMVGTQLRKLFLDPKLPKLSEEAVKSIVNELDSNPAAVQELISALQRAYGAYEHFTPDMRKIITAYTPFGAWMFNAITFLVRVLPADHPGLTALLAANASATQQYRRDNALDATLAGEKGAGQRPAFLLGSIPTPSWYARLTGTDKGDPIRLARYTPFGIATDLTSTLAGAVLPQIPLEALQGFDFAGRPLHNPDGSPQDDSQKIETFITTFGLGTIPLIGQIARGIQKGPLAVVNPFQPVQSKVTTSGSSSGSGFPTPSLRSGSSSSSSSGGAFPTPSLR